MMSMHKFFIILPACVGLAACVGGTTPKDASERSPSEIYLLKGVQYMEHGRLDVALQDLKHAVELDDRSVEAHNALGVLYERLEKNDKAEAEFKEALSLDETNPSVINNYGHLLCTQGKTEEAMKLFRSVFESKLNKTPWQAYTNAGICIEKTGQHQEAEAYLRKALEDNPDFTPALLEMAKLSMETGNYLSARAFLQRYESVANPSPESLMLGAQTERAMGNSREANDYSNKLQKLFPDSKEALHSRKSHLSQ